MLRKRSFNLENGGIKKRSRTSVTLETKLEVLRRIDASQKIVEICKALGLPKSTVQTIRANKEKINAYSQSAAPLSFSKLTRQRSSIMVRMEKLLSIWIEDNNQRRVPMSQMTIQEKAKSIFDYLKSEDTNEASADETFLASRGWFHKFKNRHNLHIKMKGEAASADANAALNYQSILKRLIERGGYLPEQVFNVGETGLYWKRMLERTYMPKNEKSASGYKVSRERLTLLLGANAAGDFKLKPLLVYSSENPRAFKGFNKNELPVIWMSSKKAQMTKILFEDWFKNYFCPDVKNYLQDKNLSSKVLLLLGDVPGHQINLSELSDDVEIEYLPKNTTALIQPMDQGTIATFKAHYLQRTFRQLIDETGDERSVKQFWRNYNIKDAVDNISESWNELASTTMNHAWKKIWPECVTTNDSEVDSLPEIRQNILNLENELGLEDVEEPDVLDLQVTVGEPLSNEELMQLEKGRASDEEQEPVVSQQFTSKDLLIALSHFEQGIKILRQNDPDKERSAKVSRGINKAIKCYKELQKEVKSNTK